MESGRERAHDDVASLLAAKDAENTALHGEIAALRDENAALLGRVTQLEGVVAALHAQLGRDSSNSGKPPSSDSPFTKKPAPKRSVRTKSGKPRGKQPGASGTTLLLIDDPDDTITHTPAVCAGCGEGLADAAVFGVCRHQVFDVAQPPPRPYVTEYRAVSKTCGGCGTTTEATVPGLASGRVQYGPGVKARAAWLTSAHFLPVRRARRVVNALLGFTVSDGWVAGLRAQAARLLEERFLPHVRALIATASVAHADETTARANGALHYLHVACTRFLTVMHAGTAAKTPSTLVASGQCSPGCWCVMATPATNTSTRSNTPGAASTWSETCDRFMTPTQMDSPGPKQWSTPCCWPTTPLIKPAPKDVTGSPTPNYRRSGPATPGRSPAAGTKTPPAATHCTNKPAPYCDASDDNAT
jgi:transposase